jgi:hypothetical protein
MLGKVKNNGCRILFPATIIVVQNNIVARMGELSNRVVIDLQIFAGF